MSSVITGNAATVDTYLSRVVSGATNATPIVITTTASHLFATYDRVVVGGVGGNTAADGEWVITVLSSTTFSLTGSVGNGAYTSGGTAIDISLTPQFTIPSDGDDLSAASVNVALEVLADRTQFLAMSIKNRMDEFLVGGTWTVPDNVHAITLHGYGGGGGGGIGGDGATGTDLWSPGGGGGGGALSGSATMLVTPGEVVSVTIGAGGASNNDGNFTVFGGTYFNGGGRGNSATGVQSTSSTTPLVVPPGSTVSMEHPSYGDGQYMVATSIRDSYALGYSGMPGEGGAGLSSNSAFAPSRNGVAGFQGNGSGGSAGPHGSSAGSYRGGGGGGGGGGGVGDWGSGVIGTGGIGGSGPSGNSGGAGSVGVAGSSADANTGAGGGGGSGGSCGTSGTPAGGAGGAGGSGRLRIYYVGPQAVLT